MLAFKSLHILTIKDGEVYIHHFWLLVVLAVLIFHNSPTIKNVLHRGKDDE